MQTIILAVVLYGCETWCNTKGEEVTGGWRRLNNEELHNLYASPNVLREVKLWRMSTHGRDDKCI
jgi:hypothetical protein